MRPVTVNERWTLNLPDWLAEWDVWPDWERERLGSIAEHMAPGDVLFDVGAEAGWMSALLGQIVGPSSMCLFEGSPDYWPTIMQIWEANHDLQPRACWPGLVSDATAVPPFVDYDHHPRRGVWPGCAHDGEPITEGRPYRYLHGHGTSTPQITLDDFVRFTHNVPKGITIDVEGAELVVVRGAEKTLAEHRPHLWVSLHPDLMQRDYGHDATDLHRFLTQKVGYRGGTLLALDHEEHWYWEGS